MSRTLRRRKFKTKHMFELGYLCHEFELSRWSWLHGQTYRWESGWCGEHSGYKEYLDDAISSFYWDCGHSVVLSYDRAPKWFRTKRNRRLRLAHKAEIHHQLVDFSDDVMLTPFIHNAGWDYW